MIVFLLIISIPETEQMPHIEIDTTQYSYPSSIKYEAQEPYKTLDSVALTISYGKENIEYSYTYRDFMEMYKWERDNVAFTITLIQVASNFDVSVEDAKAWNQFLWDLLPKRIGMIDSLLKER